MKFWKVVPPLRRSAEMVRKIYPKIGSTLFESMTHREFFTYSPHKNTKLFIYQSPKSPVHKSPVLATSFASCHDTEVPDHFAGTTHRPTLETEHFHQTPLGRWPFTGLVKTVNHLFLALEIPGGSRPWMMTSSSLMTAVAFNNSLLLSTSRSCFSWLIATNFFCIWGKNYDCLATANFRD